MLRHLLTVFAFICLASLSMAQARKITITSPKSGDFLGKTNQIKFSVENAKFQVNIKVKATFLATGESITVEGNFTPTASGSIIDSLNLNFSESAPQSDATHKWKVEITPLEVDENGNNFNYGTLPKLTNMNVDIKAPAFFSLNPLDSTFVKGDANSKVAVTAELKEVNIDKWKVQIDGSDIPNNEGSTSIVNVLWDIKGVNKNGQHTVSIKVDDKAKNTTSKNLSLTIDRTIPRTEIISPGPNTVLPPNTDVLVSLKVTDDFGDSVDVTGIDVVAKTLGGKFITRVARKSFSSSGNVLTWSGRIRWTTNVPNEFFLVVTAIDKAGNLALPQQTRVKIGSR